MGHTPSLHSAPRRMRNASSGRGDPRKPRERAKVLRGLSRDYLSSVDRCLPAGSRSATPGDRGTTCTARYGAPANACRRMLSAHLVGADRCSGERGALRYAAHLALRAVKRDGVFTLSERYGGKKKIGTFAAHRPERVRPRPPREMQSRDHPIMLLDIGCSPLPEFQFSV